MFHLQPSILRLLVASLSLIAHAKGFAQLPDELSLLKKLEGNWDVVITTGPNEKKSHGERKCAFTCGGRWLSTSLDAKIDGEDYQGRAHESFDTVKKKYVMSYVDSLVTSPLIFEGDFDKAQSKLSMVCITVLGGAGQATIRSVLKFLDADHQVLEMHLTVAGSPETKVLTMEYSRQK